MKRIFVNLNKIDDLKRFIVIVAKFPSEVYAQHNEYVVSAKSLLGLLSLDLNKPLCIRYDDTNVDPTIISELEEFSIEGD